MIPKGKQLPGIVMEFKTVQSEEELESAAAAACKQIEEKEYITELKADGVTNIWCYGIAFCKKHVAIKALE